MIVNYVDESDLGLYSQYLEQQDGSVGGEWGDFQVLQVEETWTLLLTHDDAISESNPYGIAEILEEGFSSEETAWSYKDQLIKDGWCL